MAESAEACVASSDLVVITTPWPQFRSIPAAAFAPKGGNRLVVIDCWRVLPPGEHQSAAKVIYLGFGDHRVEVQDAAPAQVMSL